MAEGRRANLNGVASHLVGPGWVGATVGQVRLRPQPLGLAPARGHAPARVYGGPRRQEGLGAAQGCQRGHGHLLVATAQEVWLPPLNTHATAGDSMGLKGAYCSIG